MTTLRTLVFSTLIAGLPATVPAGGIPVIDVTNIVQTTLTALENVDQTANQITQIQKQIEQFNKLQEQLNQQVAQFQSLTGNYGMGALLNGTTYRNYRRFIPTSWQDTLGLLQSAGVALHQTSARTAGIAARTAGQLYTPSDLYSDLSTGEAQRFVREANAVFTHLGVAQSNYEQTGQRVQTVEDIAQQIDSANDLKAAVDLQNRIAAENAFLMAELIKLQSAQHINASEMRLNEHNRRAVDKRMARSVIPKIPAPGP